MNNKKLDTALYYASLGMAVFPCIAGKKAPATKHGFKDATKDENKIRDWWGKDPNYNIGIACGVVSDGLVVIDCDYKKSTNEKGLKNFLSKCAEYGIVSPRTAIANTPNFGTHIYYKCNDSAKIMNSVSKVCDLVDLRSDGGYIIAPDSNIGIRQYSWRNDISNGIAEMPQELFDMIIARQKGDGSNTPAEEYQRKKIDINNIQQGNRNDTLYRAGCSFFAKGTQNQKDLFAMIMAVNQYNCHPPLPEIEVKRIVDSVMKLKQDDYTVDTLEITVQGVRLQAKQIKDKKVPLKGPENCKRIIAGDPRLCGKIAYDTFSEKIFVLSQFYDDDCYQEYPRPLIDDDLSELAAMIDKYYRLQYTKVDIKNAVSLVSKQQAFNPILDYFGNLQWDGKKRVNTLLHDALGAEKNAYTAEVMRLWMHGAVERIKHPGCKFDYMLTLIGKQGVGKSQFLQKIAHNSQWEEDNFNSIDGDQALMKLRGKWIIELAELLATKKTKEVEAIKAFLTSQTDTYRLPYAILTESHQRKCVFAATTNEDMFLTDLTGNRRYLPVNCYVCEPTIDMWSDDFEEYVNQCWAEILAEEDYKLVLSSTGEEYRNQKLAEHQEDDPKVGAILDWLEVHKMDTICVPQIINEVLNQDYKITPRYLSNDIHKILKNQKNWHKVNNASGGRKKVGNYGVQIAYEYTLSDNEKEEVVKEAERITHEDDDEEINIELLEFIK